MLYKFKSKDSADVIMMGPTGDQLLKALGRTPSVKGIVDAVDLSAAMAAIEQAIADEEAAWAEVVAEAKADGRQAPVRTGVSLRQRAWPLMEMMRRAAQHEHPVMWGV